MRALLFVLVFAAASCVQAAPVMGVPGNAERDREARKAEKALEVELAAVAKTVDGVAATNAVALLSACKAMGGAVSKADFNRLVDTLVSIHGGTLALEGVRVKKEKVGKAK